MRHLIDPKSLVPSTTPPFSQLDSDEKWAIVQLAFEDPEVGEALKEWAEMSIRGRNGRADGTLCDRLEALLVKNRELYHRDVTEGEDDPWEAA